MALRIGHGGLLTCALVEQVLRDAFQCCAEPRTMKIDEEECLRTSLCGEQSTQNWNAQGESDCLIKTKHCDVGNSNLRNVTSAQCSEC